MRRLALTADYTLGLSADACLAPIEALPMMPGVRAGNGRRRPASALGASPSATGEAGTTVAGGVAGGSANERRCCASSSQPMAVSGEPADKESRARPLDIPGPTSDRSSRRPGRLTATPDLLGRVDQQRAGVLPKLLAERRRRAQRPPARQRRLLSKCSCQVGGRAARETPRSPGRGLQDGGRRCRRSPAAASRGGARGGRSAPAARRRSRPSRDTG